ncbi:MAG: putative membrane protein YdgH [Candidatus Izimaplasma bacterium HR2]|nr:MAG: putative membrane protein YdgH [Candidatus Izimaplasma bacterium HR2]
MNNSDKSRQAIRRTIKKLAPAIVTALIATGLGLLSLYTSPVPMIQDFGKMLTIGMVVSLVAAILILLPIIFLRDSIFHKYDDKKKVRKTKNNNKFENVMKSIAVKTLKFKYIILAVAVLTAGIGIVLDQDVNVETDIETFMPQDTPELLDIQELRDIIGTTETLSIVFSDSDGIFTSENITWMIDMTNDLQAEFPEEVVGVKSLTAMLSLLSPAPLTPELVDQLIVNLPDEQLKMLINEDQTTGVIIVSIVDLEPEDTEAFIDDLGEFLDASGTDMDVTVTGQAVIDVEMITALTTGRYLITLVGMLLVFLGLLVIYRNPLKAIIPLIPISLIVGWSGGFMYIFGLEYTPLTATLGALIIGIGTEFTILIMERYFEEKEKREDNDEAIAVTIGKMGKPIIASALTTIGGFSALVISDFEILSNFGIMTLVNISLALLSTIIVMPAVLSIQNNVINKFKKNKPVEVKV